MYDKIPYDLISVLKRYFKGEVVGSYHFVELGLLDDIDINDIDIVINIKHANAVKELLKDYDYKEYSANKYDGFDITYSRYDYVPIHIDFYHGEKSKLDFKKVLIKKVEKSLEDKDLKQIKKIFGRIEGVYWANKKKDK